MSDAIPEPMKVDNKKFWIISAIAVGAFILGALVMNVIVPTAQLNSFASNEEVRNAYGVDIIDNPNFTGKDMLKVNDEKLAEFCVRPTVKEVQKKKPLDCKVA